MKKFIKILVYVFAYFIFIPVYLLLQTLNTFSEIAMGYMSDFDREVLSRIK